MKTPQTGQAATPVLLLLHLQNAVVHPDGFIAARGNAAQVAQRGVIEHVAEVLDAARNARATIVHVGNAFDENYSGLNFHSAMFAGLARDNRMQRGSWETQFHDRIRPRPTEPVLFRAGLGLYANTNIASLLPGPEHAPVYVAGVSTRLVVEAAVFELTDRGYDVTIIENCCAAASEQLHAEALAVLDRLATISTSEVVCASLSTPTSFSAR